MRLGTGALVPLLLVALSAGGCARRLPAPDAGVPVPTEAAAAEAPAASPVAAPPPAADATGPAPGPPSRPGPLAPPEQAADPEVATAAAIAAARAGTVPPRLGLRELCRRYAPEREPKLDATRRVLHETICGANLWLDTLFGGVPDVENARRVAGRLEFSSIYTEHDGYDPKFRLRLNYDLPNLKHRFNLFLGREDASEAIEDRREPFAVRSSVFGLEADEQWLTGLGYSPPGRYEGKFDFRLGIKIQSESKVFLQARYRRNFFLGNLSVVRFRETLFWENREAKFGATTNLDFDRVVRPDLLVRWGNVGTVSGKVEGLAWRSSLLAYKNLPGSRAFSTELFVRGESEADVPLREYGARGIYRFSILRKWLFLELIAGYSWPREELEDPREGSAMIGFGLDLWFGEEPW